MAPIPRLDPVLRDATGELLLRRATQGDSDFAFAMREAELRRHRRDRDAFHDGEATVTGSLTRAMGKSSESPATDAPCAPFRQAEGSCRFSQPRPPPRASALVQRESTTR